MGIFGHLATSCLLSHQKPVLLVTSAHSAPSACLSTKTTAMINWQRCGEILLMSFPAENFRNHLELFLLGRSEGERRTGGKEQMPWTRKLFQMIDQDPLRMADQ